MADTFSGQPIDEVLASIRRIIAEEPAAQGTPPHVTRSEDDVLELVDSASEPPFTAAPSTLLSDVTAAASRQALSALSGVTIDPDAPANSMDGLVREMLRPMLKAWLDANLPDLVERLVAREIARIGAR